MPGLSSQHWLVDDRALLSLAERLERLSRDPRLLAAGERREAGRLSSVLRQSATRGDHVDLVDIALASSLLMAATHRRLDALRPDDATSSASPAPLAQPPNPSVPAGSARERSSKAVTTPQPPAAATTTWRTSSPRPAPQVRPDGSVSPHPPHPRSSLPASTPSLRRAHRPAPVARRAGAIGWPAAVTVCVLGLVIVLYTLFVTALLEDRWQSAATKNTSGLVVSEPDIGLYAAVRPSDSRHDLALGPGLVPGSGSIGSDIPMVIVGHRTTAGAPFAHLAGVRLGSDITIDAGQRSVRYVVTAVRHQRAGASVGVAAGPPILVLETADPWSWGSGRLVVVARLVGTASGPTGTLTVVPPRFGWSPASILVRSAC